MSFNPVQLTPTPKHRQADDFAYSFQFVEDASPLNLTTFDDVIVKVYNSDATIFSQSSASSENTISSSAGTNNDIISGTVTGAVMDIAVRQYFIDVYVMLDGKKTTYVSSKFEIVGSGVAGTTDEWLITITNSTDTATGERATNIMALAVEYKNDAETAKTAAETARTGAETARTGAETAETNAGISATSASNSATSASNDANDAEKQAQNTTSFTDSNGVTFTKGAKGWSQDAETSKTGAETAETNTINALDQNSTDLAGYYLKEISNRVVVGEPIWLPESAPADVVTPPSGYASLFFDSTNSNALSKKNSAGTTTAI